MTAAKKSPSKTAPKKSTPSASGKKSASSTPDAIKLLMQDHKEVKALFAQYETLVDDEADHADKLEVATQICQMLSVHAQIEEEIFYPAAREVLDEESLDLVDEADVEHASAKDLIAQIEASSPAEDHYDAKVKVLGEYIDHHVQEEENELFKAVKKAGLDAAVVGEELAARKEELLSAVGLETPA